MLKGGDPTDKDRPFVAILPMVIIFAVVLVSALAAIKLGWLP